VWLQEIRKTRCTLRDHLGMEMTEITETLASQFTKWEIKIHLCSFTLNLNTFSRSIRVKLFGQPPIFAPQTSSFRKSSYFQIVNFYLGTTLLITEIEKKLLPLVRTLVFKNDFPVRPMLLDFTGSLSRGDRYTVLLPVYPSVT